MNEHKARRLSLQRTYGKWYKRHLIAGGTTCFYCGELRACLDHRPPLELVHSHSPEHFLDLGVPLCLIPSCHDCNGRLHSLPLYTVLEAIRYLQATLAKQYEKRAARWGQDELKEMSPMFQAIICRRLESTLILLCRVRFLQSRELAKELLPVIEPIEGNQYA